MSLYDKIFKLRLEAIEEAKIEAQKVMVKHSEIIRDELKKSLPKGHTMVFGNGCTFIHDENGEELAFGRAWGTDNDDLDELCTLLGHMQYSLDYRDDFRISFDIENIK